MSETTVSEMASPESEKPVVSADDVKLPPFPDPTDNDFDEDILEEERFHYKTIFPDLNNVVSMRLHCTACDRHLGCSATNESRMRPHPMLRTLICQTCHSFYNSGEFDKGEDGSELYCRWCGQGGQVYCCSDCIHVFCAKCIKRNLGLAKIREIENTEDWKCFKCNPKCLWDLRAMCWALLRYCDQRNKIVLQTEDVELREMYAKIVGVDATECCKNKARRSQKTDSAKKKEKDTENVAKKILSKIPPTIQVKKFASVSIDDIKPKVEKKPQKRPASPKNKSIMIKNPITIAPLPIGGSINKKLRMHAPGMFSPIRYSNPNKLNLTRVQRPRILGTNSFNGFNSPGVYMNNMNNMNNINMNNINLVNDNINLSLDSLTQGLDFAAVQAMNNSNPVTENNDDVVCTPDFPMEPLCEVTEDNDDDVECITPGPVAAPKISNPPPLVPVRSIPAPSITKGNVIQMTDSDVTVNALTGGLKFRVDPQTLSSNKMYRLPDGRIFAINANPNMPGGYSATIVSQNPDGTPKVTPRSETFAAKLSTVSHSSPKARRGGRTATQRRKNSPNPRVSKPRQAKETPRATDLKVPVEWYRYNMIDAVDALEYSLSRLHKLKKETTSAHLRTRTVDEMKYLHRKLEQLLTTSSKRFIEIRDTLNKEMKMYISNKENNGHSSVEEDDDDVEILPNTENEDPIFIEEISDNEGQEVDLTGAASSEHNDSAENRVAVSQEIDNNHILNDSNSATTAVDFGTTDPKTTNNNGSGDSENAKEELLGTQDVSDKMETEENPELSTNSTNLDNSDPKTSEQNGDDDKTDNDKTDDEDACKPEDNNDTKKTQKNDKDEVFDEENDDNQNTDDETDKSEKEFSDKRTDKDNENQDGEMSEEMIETLLKDDNLDENACMEMSDLQEAEEILS